jgi:hypothetical protein
VYLKEGTYHTRLFRGPRTMIWKSRMVLAAPGPLLTPPPSSFPPKTLSGPTPPKFDPCTKQQAPVLVVGDVELLTVLQKR